MRKKSPRTVKRRHIEHIKTSHQVQQKIEKLGARRAVTLTCSITVKAPVERCFECVSRQLDQTPIWDPTLVSVMPIAIRQNRIGSMSRVIVSLNGYTEEAVALVRSYTPNRSILWTSTHSMQLQQEWHFRHLRLGRTLVIVVTGYNPKGNLVRRLSERVVLRRKVCKAMEEMLDMLKREVEIGTAAPDRIHTPV